LIIPPHLFLEGEQKTQENTTSQASNLF